MAQAEGIAAELEVRRTQLNCKRCYGDSDAVDPAGYVATIGKAGCTCPSLCPRPHCQAPGDLDDLNQL